MVGCRGLYAEIFVLTLLPILGNNNLRKGRKSVHQLRYETLLVKVANDDVLLEDEDNARGAERTNANR